VEKKRTSINLNLPQLTSKNLNEPQNCQMNVKGGNNNVLAFKCEYCSKIIPHIKNYKRHLRTSCEEIPLSKRKLLLEKYNKNKNHIKKVTAITNNNNIQNNNINNIQNNNQKLTIKINPLGKEDISSICEEKIIEFLGEGAKGFVNFISSIYKIDENRNIFIKSKKENIVQFINKDYELDIGDLNEIISDITLSHHNVFEDLFELHQDKISKVNKSKFERVSKSYSNNPERFERKTYLSLVNINKINKKYIDNFLRIKGKDGSEQVLIGRL